MLAICGRFEFALKPRILQVMRLAFFAAGVPSVSDKVRLLPLAQLTNTSWSTESLPSGVIGAIALLVVRLVWNGTGGGQVPNWFGGRASGGRGAIPT